MRARAHWPGGFPIRTRRIDLPSAPHVKSAPGEAIAGKAPAQILHENISTGRSDDDNTQNAAQPGRAESDRGDRVAEEVSESSRGPYLLRVRQSSLTAALLLRRRMNWRRLRAAARNLSRWLSIRTAAVSTY